MELRVQRRLAGAQLPTYAHAGDAGLDLYAAEAMDLPPGESRMVDTGISIQLPVGTEGQVRPRSGLAAKHQVTVLNSPGTIDEGYRGPLKVIVINHGRAAFHVEPGARIAQLVIAPVLRVDVAEVTELNDTTRGTGGFGSTGR